MNQMSIDTSKLPSIRSFPCQICNQEIPTKALIISEYDNNYIFTCAKCYGYLNHCSTCIYGDKCGFKTDYSEPQIVNRVISQGGMRIQTQVRNPNLIEKHCISCRCSYDDKGNCNKEHDNGYHCSHYSIIPELLQQKI